MHPAICWYLALASAWSCRFWCWQFRMPSIMAILAWLLQAPHYSVLREDRWGFRCSAQSLPRIWRMDWPRECRLEQVCTSQPITKNGRAAGRERVGEKGDIQRGAEEIKKKR